MRSWLIIDKFKKFWKRGLKNGNGGWGCDVRYGYIWMIGKVWWEGRR